MKQGNSQKQDFVNPLRRFLIGILCLCLIALFLIWRIDNPRVEKLRADIVDTVVPSMNWFMAPTKKMVDLVTDFRSYQKLVEQNQELRRELQKMQSWKEAALKLRQENAKLLDLNNLKLNQKHTYISGIVMADSGSPFSQSVLLNVGERDGVKDGWAAMDGLGLVGRVSGTGQNTSRVILLTDISSQIPDQIQPSGQHAVVAGDNSLDPRIDFVKDHDVIRPGDRIVTSGKGGVLPPDLLIGQLVVDTQKRLRVRLAADYERLEFFRVLRTYNEVPIAGTGELILPSTRISAAEPTQATEE